MAKEQATFKAESKKLKEAGFAIMKGVGYTFPGVDIGAVNAAKNAKD